MVQGWVVVAAVLAAGSEPGAPHGGATVTGEVGQVKPLVIEVPAETTPHPGPLPAEDTPAEPAPGQDGPSSAAPAPSGPRLADASPIVLQRVANPDGTAVERILERSGEIVLHELNPVGTVLSCKTVGSLLTLRIIDQQDAAGGEVVTRAVEPTSGQVVRYVVDAEGEPRAVELLGRP